MGMSDACMDFQRLLGEDVDLINLRDVSTEFRKEIVMSGRRMFSREDIVSDEFEFRVLSSYQKLNEERAGVIGDGIGSGRFYDI